MTSSDIPELLKPWAKILPYYEDKKKYKEGKIKYTLKGCNLTIWDDILWKVDTQEEDEWFVEFGYQWENTNEFFFSGGKIKWLYLFNNHWNGYTIEKTYTPYVFNKGCILTDEKYSFLPEKISKEIPSEYQYWNKENKNEVKNKYVEYIIKKWIKLPSFEQEEQKDELNNFTLQKHFWKGRINNYFDLRFDFKDWWKWLHLQLRKDPMLKEKINCILNNQEVKDEEWIKLMSYNWYMPPLEEASKLNPNTFPNSYKENPSKNTPCWINKKDNGKAKILKNEADYKLIRMVGSNLKWDFEFKKKWDLWIMSKID